MTTGEGTGSADRMDFFISYTQADLRWAEWIAWQLKKAGYTVKLQAWHFRAGGNIPLDIDESLKGCQRMIAVLSPDYEKSDWCSAEWSSMFARDPSGATHALVPVLVREYAETGLLGARQYIDLADLDAAAAREKLLEGVKLTPPVPAAEPSYPGAPQAGPVEEPPFPASLPDIWNIPPESHNFTGREELLRTLRNALAGGRPIALTQAAICGLGGVGKTQLARAYASRHAGRQAGRHADRQAGDYSLGWWVRAEGPATIIEDYKELAQRLGIQVDESRPADEVVAAVTRTLAQRPGWLLVFDNAPGPEQVKPYLPPRGGHVIFTSRRQLWGDIAQSLPVTVLEPAEAVALLVKRSSHPAGEAAEALAQELGCFPLALVQAGAYIDEARSTYAAYLALFQKRRQELLRDNQPLDYQATVATTWDISLERVRAEAPAAADLMNLCTFLAPDDIPRAVLQEPVPNCPQPLADALGDPLAFDRVLVALRRYSLCDVDALNASLSVHRLVQAVLRDKLSAQQRHLWAAVAAKLVAQALPADPDDPKTWPACRRLLPHALALAHGEEAPQSSWDVIARLSFGAAKYLAKSCTGLDDARWLLERALALNEDNAGPDSAQSAADLLALGGVLEKLGDLHGARVHLERALALNETNFGSESTHVAASLLELGGVLEKLGDLHGARVHLERALAVDERLFSSESTHVAVSLLALGGVLLRFGDLHGARVHLERALALNETNFGSESTHVAASLLALGGVLLKLGDLQGARVHLERALAIDENRRGPEHFYTVLTASRLGRLLRRLGDPAAAKPLLERVLRFDEHEHGPGHPRVAAAAMDLGLTLEKLGDRGGAKTHFERAYDIYRKNLGEDHPQTKAARSRLDALGG